MKRSYRNANIGLITVIALNVCAVLNLGCGAFGTDGFLGLGTCEILNCEGLFFSNLAEDGHGEEGLDAEVADDHAEDTASDAVVEADGHDGEEDAPDVVEGDGHDEAIEGTGGDVPPQSKLR